MSADLHGAILSLFHVKHTRQTAATVKKTDINPPAEQLLDEINPTATSHLQSRSHGGILRKTNEPPKPEPLLLKEEPMAKTTRRLGRGLDSLVSNLRAAPQQDEKPARPQPGGPPRTEHESHENEVTARPKGAGVAEIPIDRVISNPFQPRSQPDDDDVRSLADSIRQSGLLQPIAVRPHGDRYQIIAGERRWRAARLAGFAAVPAIVRDASDEEMLELALIENLQREDLNAIERAKAYRTLCVRFGLKPDQIADRLAEDRSTVVNYLRLLDLPGEIHSMVASGRISMAHARCLAGVDDHEQCLIFARTVIDDGLSVRALEELIRRQKTAPIDTQKARPASQKPRSANLADVQKRFEEALKTKVVIQEGRRKGTGRIVIHFFSLDDFDRVVQRLFIKLE